MKLPIISDEIVRMVGEELERGFENDEFITHVIERLKRNNQNIADFIGELANESDDPVRVAICGAVVFRLLEAQAEAEGEERPTGYIN